MHRHDGVDLDESYAQATLRNLNTPWKCPVHLASQKETAEFCLHLMESSTQKAASTRT